MPVDQAFQPMLDAMAAMGPEGIESLSPDEARAVFKSLAMTDGEPTPVASVHNRLVPGPNGDVPVRIYTPEGQGPFAMLAWLHGGGWVIGDLDTADPTARKLCARAGVIVVSVDYRLAPEHPAPAPLQDCQAAVDWMADNAAALGGDPARIGVGGDSAGGNLAAVVAQRAAVSGPRLSMQLLVYPVTDLTMSHPSIVSNGEGYFLTTKGMAWFTAHYLSGGASAEDPDLSPIFADDVSGVAPAVVITAEYDPLRDEGEAFAAKLEAAGVDVTAKRYDGMIHGFLSMAAVTPVADEAVDLLVDAMRNQLAASTV